MHFKASAHWMPALLGLCQALPSSDAADLGHASKPYKAPGPDDSRGPCPMLNTLANHAYINHDGRNIEQQDIINALNDQVGIDKTAIETAMVNAFVVCKYVTGQDCGTTLRNLTLLAEPHAFEHDHSFSREDYMMNYLPPSAPFSDNQNFNETIFETSIDVLKGSSHMTYAQMNQVRLQRESLALQNDKKGWFLESKPIQEFEAGFIFAVMGDFNLPNYNTTPEVRVDWWRYWFHNESLPYPLGWLPPKIKRGLPFVASVSQAILAAQVTSTPTPLPSGAIGPAEAPGTLNEATATTTYAIPTFRPYAAAGVGPNDKRAETAPTRIPAAVVKNPYVDVLDVADIAAQQAHAVSRMLVGRDAQPRD